MQRREFLRNSMLAGSGLLLSRSRAIGADTAQARIDVLLNERIGTVAPEIFGHFIEHIGGVIYDGVWVGMGSGIANTAGIRQKLIDGLKAIRAPVIRWPGGCFADSYDWRDGIGPRQTRPRRTDFWANDPKVWKLPNDSSVKFDPNAFGTDEFMKLCRMTGAEPYLAANLRSLPAYAFDQWVEYCNSPAGSTTYADKRAQNGSAEPYQVQYWGVGNESWGCGGELTPEEYASEYRRFQSWVPRYGMNLRLIASGPNGRDVRWTADFLQNILGERPIAPPWGLSLHYYTNLSDALKFLSADVYPGYAKADEMETIILDNWAAMGMFDRTRSVKLVVDEYGPSYPAGTEVDPSHLFGQQITMRDAIMTALTLDIFVRHAEKVSMANCAQLINCINSLFLAHEEHFIETPNFHVFDMYASHQGGESVRAEFAASSLNLSSLPHEEDAVREGIQKPARTTLWGLNGSASLNRNRLTLTVVNPSLTDTQDTLVWLDGGKAVSVEAKVLTASDIHAHNTFEQPDMVRPASGSAVAKDDTVRFSFPPSSVTTLLVTLAAG